uniref:Helicase ATP-binding domain-containing protein n=1 Tax=Panagrolaimus sp. JU765 TaxID=591449 RepID=A0AC34Q143_9BILA
MKRSRVIENDENAPPKKFHHDDWEIKENIKKTVLTHAPSSDASAHVVDHPYSFPFPPYPTQLKLMSDLYKIFEDKCIGILESPTGTGKTLSSLCAVLSFLEDENQRIQRNIESNREKVKELKTVFVGAEFDEAMKIHKEMREYEEKAEVEEDKLERIRRRISEARSRYDHYQTTQEVEIEDCGNITPEKEPESPPELLKVVYATRTHSQIDQLTAELKRTRFQPRVVSLGSRSVFCPNSEVNKLPNSAAGDKCKDLRETNKCPYYKHSKVVLLSDHILAGITRDAQDVLKESTCLKACGYYASRAAVPFCE